MVQCSLKQVVYIGVERFSFNRTVKNKNYTLSSLKNTTAL